MQKILLVDSSRVFCESLRMTLGEGYDAKICMDGLQALEMLDEFRPDIMVTELTLAGMDGLTLLENAAARPNRPVLVAITRLDTSFVHERVERIGVDYYMVKPCNIRILAERILDLSPNKSQPEPFQYTVADLTVLLRDMNVNMSRRSCKYLFALVELYLEDPSRSLTKELYPAVGELCDSNGLAVERAVRSLIEDAWKNRNDQVWRAYFPMDRHGTVIKPTNRCFITAMAMALKSRGCKMA